MLFTSAAPGPYDVRFSLLGFPVRISPVFWIVALLLSGGGTPQEAIIVVAAILISILVHELGHALLQRAFGGYPEIVLYAFGGYASAYGVRESWWRNILISLAGPFAGFFLAGLVWAYKQLAGEPREPSANLFIEAMLWINTIWGLVNLLPVWPLDGGRVSREVLTLLMKPSTGIVVSLAISAVVAACFAAWCLMQTQSILNTALFAMLAYQSYETMQQYRASRGGW